MSASLVGSEMCIRDSTRTQHLCLAAVFGALRRFRPAAESAERRRKAQEGADKCREAQTTALCNPRQTSTT
eukprot:11872689-Alexandrium_andersonii.AAC.1